MVTARTSTKQSSPAQRLSLTARHRQRTSTRAVRRVRQQGFVPGVVYGKTVEAMPVLVSRHELTKLLRQREGEHGLLTLSVEASAEGKPGKGHARFEKPVLIKSLQRHPVNGEIVHIDFHAITLTEHIRIKIPIVLQGDPVGVKQDGGILEHFLREIEVECLPTEIPKQVEFDISPLKIGDAVHARDLTPPSGARITTDPESVIVSVLTPKVEKVEEPTEAVTEPEVIREKKPEAEAEGSAAGKEKEEKKKEEKKEEK